MKTKLESKTSLTLTLVALEGPLLVTLIVKLTKSFTYALPVILDCLIIVKLTTGQTVMLVPLAVTVEFSVELTEAKLVNVPLVKTLTTTQTS